MIVKRLENINKESYSRHIVPLLKVLKKRLISHVSYKDLNEILNLKIKFKNSHKILEPVEDLRRFYYREIQNIIISNLARYGYNTGTAYGEDFWKQCSLEKNEYTFEGKLANGWELEVYLLKAKNPDNRSYVLKVVSELSYSTKKSLEEDLQTHEKDLGALKKYFGEIFNKVVPQEKSFIIKDPFTEETRIAFLQEYAGKVVYDLARDKKPHNLDKKQRNIIKQIASSTIQMIRETSSMPDLAGRNNLVLMSNKGKLEVKLLDTSRVFLPIPKAFPRTRFKKNVYNVLTLGAKSEDVIQILNSKNFPDDKFKPEIYGYWYPNDPYDPQRIKRAKKKGYSIPNETELVQVAKPLFENHPKYGTHKPNIKYCLGESKQTVWVDTDKHAMEQQIKLGMEYGLTGIIWDTYVGVDGKKTVKELHRPFEKAFYPINKGRMKFGFMFCLSKSRVLLPISAQEEKHQDRNIDISKESAVEIISYAARYWKNKEYIKLNNKPYIGICKFNFKKEEEDMLIEFIKELRVYAREKYNKEIHIVGITKDAKTAIIWHKAKVDSISTYSFLVDWWDGINNPAQDYETCIEKRILEWEKLKNILPFAPSVVNNFDASARGEPKKLHEVAGNYPYTPLGINNTPELFNKWVFKALNFAYNNLPAEQRYIAIKLNEITEGGCILPQLKNNEVDYSYYNALKEGINDFINKKLNNC